MNHKGRIVVHLWQSMICIYVHLCINVQDDRQDYNDGIARNNFRRQGKYIVVENIGTSLVFHGKLADLSLGSARMYARVCVCD
jgi:hypothetical protein